MERCRSPRSLTVSLSAALPLLLVSGSTATRVDGSVSVDPVSHSALLRFGPGRQVLTFRMREPSGVILLYRLRADAGVQLRASAQLAPLTVPLRIEAKAAGPGSPCTADARHETCTVGEEWCPMPRGTWFFRVTKLAGPAADATIWFRVGPPPGGGAG